MDERFNRLIAGIYGGVFSLPYSDFKEQTLRSLRKVLPFDSGIWGSGLHSTNEILSVALLDHTPEMLMTYAMNWQGEDFVRAAAVANPGVAFRNEDVMPLPEYHQTRIYREFSGPSGIEHALGTVHVDPASDVGEMLFLFRADPAQAFTDTERSIKEQLMPHLAAAWRQRQVVQTYELRFGAQPPKDFETRGHAVVDDDGMLQASDSHFSITLRDHFEGWTGPKLPAEVMAVLIAKDGGLSIRGLDFLLTRSIERHILSVTSRADRVLSKAETRVARMFADGQTNSQIAQALGVSPATVRNQIAAIYRKLEIHSKAELARLFPPSP